jgi:hypothetical protein
MGVFDKLKKVFFEEDEKKTKMEKDVAEHPDKYSSANYENEIICNSCGKVIEGTPKFFKMGDRRLIFHRKCFKKLKQGKLP